MNNPEPVKPTKPVNLPLPFPGVGEITGTNPIVVIGPNGAGKSRLMRGIAGMHRYISAQRRTYLEDQIQAYGAEQAKQQIQNQLAHAHGQPWQFSSEIDVMFGRILQEHYAALDSNNEAAKKSGGPKAAVTDAVMDRLRDFWQAVFVNRELSFSNFSPTARRTDVAGQPTYPAKTMSDGERTCLYLAARVLTADPGILVIDEPELHMHRKLAIDYWNKLEEMRPDIRFVYVTHELNFGLSRRDPVLLVVRDEGRVEAARVESLPSSLVEDLLGAATLSINANRIIFFEGVSGHGLAHDLFKRWITGGKSAVLGVGSRGAVLEAGSAFSRLGIIANAQIVAVVDRDHGPEEWLTALQPPAFVLALHEIESLFALPAIVRAVGAHLGYRCCDPWTHFLERARKELESMMPKVVAERVRASISNLLNGIFEKAQIRATMADTQAAHTTAFAGPDWQNSVPALFAKEEARVRGAMAKDDVSILVVLSGKVALNLAASILGVSRQTYADIVLEAIEKPTHTQHNHILTALTTYLPPRQ